MTMKTIRNILALLLLLCSCKDAGSGPDTLTPTRELSLSASSLTGTAPCEITFTGTFNACTDTTRMYVPDMWLLGGPGRTIIRYALPDTSVPAKRTYTSVRSFPAAGVFHMYMNLQVTTGDVWSDTLTITIY